MDECGYVWGFFRRLWGNETKQTALEEAAFPSPTRHLFLCLKQRMNDVFDATVSERLTMPNITVKQGKDAHEEKILGLATNTACSADPLIVE